MTADERRELDQLQLAAQCYLRRAKRLAKWTCRISDKSIGDVNARHELGKLHQAERVLADLTSAAIRLSTMSDRLDGDAKGTRNERYNRKFYKGSPKKRLKQKEEIIKEITAQLDEHIHDLLRDDVGHLENDEEPATDRREILLSLTIGRAMNELDSCFTKIAAKLP